MIEFLPQSAGDILATRASGIVTEEEVEAAIERFEQHYADRIIRNLYYDWVDLEGWGKGARTVGTWFGMHNWATIRKIAIVADERWHDECQRVADINKLAEVRWFAPEDRENAWAWLNGRVAA